MGLLANTAAALEDDATVVSPDVQRRRDVDRMAILQDERAKELKAPDTPDRALNLAALDKEIGDTSKRVPVQPSLLGGTIAALDDGGTFKPEQAPKPAPTMKERSVGAAEAMVRAASLPTRMATAAGMPAAEFLTNQATGLGNSIMGGWRGLAALASGAGLEEAARQVHEPELAGGATASTYQPAADSFAGAAVEAAGSKYNPMNWPAAAGAAMGGKVMDVTGSPAAAAAVETGINAVPLVLIRGGKVGRLPEKDVGSGSIANDAKPAIAHDTTNYDIPTVLRNRQAQAVETAAPASASPQAKAAPPAAAPMIEVPKFEEPPSAAPAGKSFAPDEQAQRKAVLARVGVADARKSAVSGDAKEANTDFQIAKVKDAAGDLMRAKMDAERAALTEHADAIVRDTGGTPGVDAHALEARGATILQPLEAFKQYFTDQTNALYKVARERAQGQPLALDKFGEILSTDSKFANTDTIELRKGIGARMKELGMIDEEGKPLPATVDKAESLRQYVNEEWSPKNNGRIRELKNALDEDVTRAAGEDIFAQARALHRMKEATFSDPKGLSSILDSEGINRKVDVERIADKITAMPNAQFGHIVKTLAQVPAELQPQAAAALAELKAHMASRLIEAAKGRQAQWGAKDVTAYLNKNAVKFEMVFSPEEMGKIRDLNDAGHILRLDTSYPGASVQAHNIVRSGAISALNSGAAATGTFIGSLVGAPGTGAAVGAAAGRALTGRFEEAAALKRAQERWVSLSDVAKGAK